MLEHTNKKMRYQIQIILRSLWRNKFTSGINILCLTLGMVISSIFICQANGAVNSYRENTKYMNLDNIFVVQPQLDRVRNHIQPSQLESIKKELKFIEEIYVTNRLSEEIVRSNNTYLTGINVYTASQEFNSCFKANYSLTGIWFKELTDCVIGEKIVQKYKLGIGDTIDIGLNRYNISGIIHLDKYTSTIFINENVVPNLELFDSLYYVKVNYSSKQNKELLYQFILKEYGQYLIKDNQMLIAEEKRRLYTGWTPSLIVGVIAFAYGILNIKNIDKFYMEQEKGSIAIMRAYGMNKIHGLVQKIVKTSVLFFIASILVYTIVYTLQFTKLNFIFNLKVDIIAYGVIFVVGLVLTILFSIITSRKLLNREIAEILREKV